MHSDERKKYFQDEPTNFERTNDFILGRMPTGSGECFNKS